MKRYMYVAIVLGSSLFSGCASVSGDSFQTLSLDVKTKKGEQLDGVQCQLSNDKGNWSAKTPSPVMVHKSAGDLTVVCTKKGYDSGTTKVASSANGGMFGNIILGGGIGAIVDHSKGTAYNYPKTVPIEMGATLDLGKKAEKYIKERNNKEKLQHS